MKLRSWKSWIAIVVTVAVVGVGGYFVYDSFIAPVTLRSISITHNPDKMEYFEYQEFDAEGMVVMAKLSNGKKEKVNDINLEYNREALAQADRIFEISCTRGKHTRSTSLNLVIKELKYELPTIRRIERMTEKICPIFEEYPEVWDEIGDQCSDEMNYAFRRAVIMEDEVNNMLEALETVIDYFENFDWEEDVDEFELTDTLLTAIISVDIPSIRKSIFLWELVSGARDITEICMNEMTEDEEYEDAYWNDETRATYLKTYDDFLSQGRENFIVSFTAFLDAGDATSIMGLTALELLSEKGSGLIDAVDELNEDEFKTIVREIVNETAETLDIFDSDVIYSVVSLTKIFLPVATAGLTDDYLKEIRQDWYYELGWDLNDKRYYEDEIRDCNNRIKEIENELAGMEPTDPGYDDLQLDLQYEQEQLQELQRELKRVNDNVERDIKVLDFLNTAISKGNYRTQLNKDLSNDLDIAASDYSQIHASLSAAIKVIDDDMIMAVYDATSEDEINTDVLAIAFGKVLNAGFSAEGGVNKDSSKELIWKYMDLLNAQIGFMGLEGNIKDIVGDDTDKLIDDAEILAALDYTTELDASFDKNYVVIFARSVFENYYNFFVYEYYADEDYIGYSSDSWDYTKADVEEWYEDCSTLFYYEYYDYDSSTYIEYSFVEVWLFENHTDFYLWIDEGIDNHVVYLPGDKLPTSKFVFMIYLEEAV